MRHPDRTQRLVVYECPQCGRLWVRKASQQAPWVQRLHDWFETEDAIRAACGKRMICDGKPGSVGGVRAQAILAAWALGGQDAVDDMVEDERI